MQLPALAGLGRARRRPGDPSRLGPRRGWGRPRGGAQAALGPAGWLPLRGAESGRPPGSKFKAPGGGRCALSAPLRSGHFPLAGAPRSPGPGQPAGAAATPAPHGPLGRPLTGPGFPAGCALGGLAPGAAPSRLPSPARPGRGRRPGLWGTLSREPRPPLQLLGAREGPPTWGPPLRPARQLRPQPRGCWVGGRGSRGGGCVWGPRIEPLPRAAPAPCPPRPLNFRPEPTHHPKNSPGENESGGGDV